MNTVEGKRCQIVGLTAHEIVSEVAKSFLIKREDVLGPVVDADREIPKLVAIKLVKKYVSTDNGIAGSIFKMKIDRIEAFCKMADQLLAQKRFESAASVEKKLEDWIESRAAGCSDRPVATVIQDSRELVSSVREKRLAECKVFTADDEWFADRMFVIDGTNVCHWGRDASVGKMSLDPLLWICADLRRHGARFMVLFDASTAYMFKRLGEEDSARCYKCLVKEHSDEFRETPAGIAADAFVLMIAADAHEGEKDRIVISNDCYSDYEKEYPMVKDVRRRLPGMVVRDNILFPSIRWSVKRGMCGYQPCPNCDTENGSETMAVIGPGGGGHELRLTA